MGFSRVSQGNSGHNTTRRVTDVFRKDGFRTKLRELWVWNGPGMVFCFFSKKKYTIVFKGTCTFLDSIFIPV